MQDSESACKIAKEALDQAQILMEECQQVETPENF